MKDFRNRAVWTMTPLALAGVGVIASLLGNALGSRRSFPETGTARLVKAADGFLATLDGDEKTKVRFAYEDGKQRARWSNFPTGFVPRAGLSLEDLTPVHREAAMAVVAAALSPKGLKKVEEIMEADEVFKRTEGARDENLFGKDLYYISFLGEPSEKTPWMLQFGGHHLAINLTVSGEKGILAPTLTGAQPATYTENGKTVRPLGEESDAGAALLSALDPGQKAKAILNYCVGDLVLGPGQDGKTIVPEGLRAAEMNANQRKKLLEAISAWVGIVDDRAAEIRMKEIDGGLDDTWFAWSGPTDVTPGRDIAAYYRIQGPKLFIEYSPQRMGGDPALHVHTIYPRPDERQRTRSCPRHPSPYRVRKPPVARVGKASRIPRTISSSSASPTEPPPRPTCAD